MGDAMLCECGHFKRTHRNIEKRCDISSCDCTGFFQARKVWKYNPAVKRPNEHPLGVIRSG